MSDDFPVIPCYVTDDGADLQFYCPYCRGPHLHGGGEGHRQHHCYTDVGSTAYNRGYFLKIDPAGHQHWLEQHKAPKKYRDLQPGRKAITGTERS
jgi:hypothetical protein